MRVLQGLPEGFFKGVMKLLRGLFKGFSEGFFRGLGAQGSGSRAFCV